MYHLLSSHANASTLLPVSRPSSRLRWQTWPHRSTSSRLDYTATSVAVLTSMLTVPTATVRSSILSKAKSSSWKPMLVSWTALLTPTVATEPSTYSGITYWGILSGSMAIPLIRITQLLCKIERMAVKLLFARLPCPLLMSAPTNALSVLPPNLSTISVGVSALLPAARILVWCWILPPIPVSSIQPATLDTYLTTRLRVA